MIDFLQEALAMREQTVAWRRHIHANAELGEHLPKTSAYVEEVLDSLAVPHERLTECGIAAWVGREEDGPTVLIRADMDALPGNETSGLPFACHDGTVHACGHDIHTASLLSAAAMLKRHESELKGRVVFMFQPAEETMTGALNLVKAGILEKFRPSLALGMHVNVSEVPGGQIFVKSGAFNASSDVYEVRIAGKGGHGAYPQNAVNPISAMLPMINAFTDISRNEVAALEPNVLTVCAIEAGKAGNVIPEKAVFRGSLRTFSISVRDRIVARMRETAETIARAYRCEAELILLGGTPPLANPPETARWAAGLLENMLGAGKIQTPVLRSMGSEDFAQISTRVPDSCYLSVGMPRIPGCDVGLHNPAIVFTEENIPLGGAAFATLAFGYLENGKN